MSFLGGGTYWAMVGGVTASICALAGKFITDISPIKKLIVYLITLIFILFLAILGTFAIENNEWTDRAVPPMVSLSESIEPSNSNASLTLLSEVVAQPNTKWIYCGTYDFASQQWQVSNLNFGSHQPAALSNQNLIINTILALYDEAPKFSNLTLKWKFGTKHGNLPAGSNVTIIEAVELGKGRIWCKIHH